MKKVLICFILSIYSITMAQNKSNNYSAVWDSVQKAQQKGLVEDAIKITEKILSRAKTEKNQPEYIKAVIHKVNFAKQKEEDALVKSIHFVDGETKTADFPAKNLLNYISATLYDEFYDNNRWQINQRTELDSAKSDDIATWTTRQFFKKMASHYKAALDKPQELQKIKVEEYEAIINKSSGRHLRPTLFDFLAFEVFNHYDTQEDRDLTVNEAFILMDPAFWGETPSFVKATVPTLSSSSKYQALLVLQQILAFRLKEGYVPALVDAELLRFDFINKTFAEKDKKNLYQTALLALENKYKSDSSSAQVSHRIAINDFELGESYDAYKDTTHRWKLKKAFDKCNETIQKFPKSYGAMLCTQLIANIETEYLEFEGEKVISSGKPFKLYASYKNLADLEFKFYKITHSQLKKLMSKQERDHHDRDILTNYYKQLSKGKPNHQKNISFPATTDYQHHSVELPIDPLNNGLYVVYVGKKGFKEGQVLAYELLQVSKLAYLENNIGDKKEIYVVDNQTGSPVSQATVEIWKEYYDYEKNRDISVKLATKVTGVDGKIVAQGLWSDHYGSFYINIATKIDSLYNDLPYRDNDNTLVQYNNSSEKVPLKEVKILTDRAIYRPGQTVYYKIIAYSHLNNKAQVLPNLVSSIELKDVNQKEVAYQGFTTNAYGSAHGSFTLPTAGLTGYHSLQVSGSGFYGNANIHVEEYKRPKFEVKFDTLKTMAKLNEDVTVVVEAISYAGAPIDQAKVSYKVNRTFRYPEYWYKIGFWLPTPQSVQVYTAEAVTEANGKASLKFVAVPDLEVYQKDKAIFTYEIIADVTDINGETHSTTTYVNVGSVGYEITASIPDKVVLERKAPLSLNIQNLNGTPIKNTTEIEVFKLTEPNRFLKQRYWKRPTDFVLSQKEHDLLFPDEIYNAEDLIAEYPVQASVFKRVYPNDGSLTIDSSVYQTWKTGAYKIVVKVKNEAGEALEEKMYFRLSSEQSQEKDVSELATLSFNKNNFVPNDKLKVLLKTQHKDIRLFYQYASEKQEINKWLAAKELEFAPYVLTEPGYVNASITYIWRNRKYSATESAFVSNVDKELNIKFETFRDKLLPGQKETWKLKISGYKNQKVQPEFLALLYDASLDQFASHSIYFDYASFWSKINYATVGNIGALHYPNTYSHTATTLNVNDKEYDTWKYLERYRMMRFKGGAAMRTYSFKSEMSYDALAPQQAPMMSSEEADLNLESGARVEQKEKESALAPPPTSLETKAQATDTKAKEEPQIRKNFQETAFFYPQLRTDSTGNVSLDFTIPEALTKWQMYGVAHTKDMKLGFVSNQLITQKDLMVSPNVPRFFREGDIITLQAKVNNLTDKSLLANAKIEFLDALNLKDITKQLVVGNVEQSGLSLAAKQSQVLNWKIKVPEGLQALTFRVYASTDTHSDAEENTVVVLSNKMLVTETLPISVSAGQSKSVKLDKLANNTSTTLRNHKLTFEYTSNPAWYVVQALPYLMEYPYECAEQVFSRFYANDLASFISNQNPRIKQVFDAWKKLDSKALLSNLEKNQELKQLIIEETPWLRDATDETEAKKRIALLFDLNRMGYEKLAAVQKLQKMQLGNGAFPWFSGMYPDRYITQHIVEGIGHLGKVKGNSEYVELDIANKAIKYLDQELVTDLQEIKRLVAEKRTTLEQNHLQYYQIHYLYARTFFKNEMDAKTKEAYQYFLGQSEKYWLENNRYAQGLIALALHRNQKTVAAQGILSSILQYALESEEMGMYWKDSYGYYWYQAPVETHALLIEAYAEINNDTKTVDKLKLWLLKQKQTTHWATTKATAGACYAMLLKGSDFLAETAKPQIKIGSKAIEINESNTELGTGYFKTAFEGKDITKDMATVTVTNNSKIANWGALYWQYFENMDKITQANTSLTIDKKLYIHQRTASGDQLVLIDNNNLKVGDLLTVRLVIKTDRNLEYIHLKDMRSAGFEPVDVLSSYRWKGGLGYYQSTRDAATNFFISYMQKGTYVFEYDLRVSHMGEFSNGITTLQCMYAPEFTAHSEGLRVTVK